MFEENRRDARRHAARVETIYLANGINFCEAASPAATSDTSCLERSLLPLVLQKSVGNSSVYFKNELKF